MCCYTFLKITICPSIYLMEVNWINYDANQLDFRIILAVFCLFTQMKFIPDSVSSVFHAPLLLLLLQIYWFVLQRQIYRKVKKNLLSDGLLPEWQQGPELSWYKARSFPGSPRWVQDQKTWGHSLLLSQAIRSELDGKQNSWHPRGISMLEATRVTNWTIMPALVSYLINEYL